MNFPNGKDLEDLGKSMTDLIQQRVKHLDSREEALELRERLAQQALKGAESSDVLDLNVGGLTNVSVLRSTLTHFEDSMLAARFSGKWDESLEKDKVGRFFIDVDPEVFRPILSFLRHSKINAYPPSPPVSTLLDDTLDYYGLKMRAYPYGINIIEGSGATIENHDILSEDGAAFVTIRPVGHNRNIVSITVEILRRTSTLLLGWQPENTSSPTSTSSSTYLDVNAAKCFDANTLVQNTGDIPFTSGTRITIRRYPDATSLCGWKVGTSSDYNRFDSPRTLYSSNYYFPFLKVNGQVRILEVEYQAPDV